ncbi:MAG: hypothetical protein WD768_05820 [Phycisphaeraceae bacterium]
MLKSITLTLALTLGASHALAEDITIPSLPFKPVSQDEVISRFMQHTLQSKAVPAETRVLILSELDAAAKDQAGEHTLTRVIVAVNPELSKALADFADEDFTKAVASLKNLSKSEDTYLAAHADFYLARAYMVQEKFEDALPILDKLAGAERSDLTLHAGEALFYKGICHDKLLERVEALISLATFLRQNPDASERLTVGAMHKVEELKAMIDGSLWDVENRMDYSRRRLDLEKPDDPTQKEQKNIIVMLDKLIEEAEQKENGGGGSGSGGGQGQGQGSGPGGQRNGVPSSPATQSTAPEGSAEIGALHKVNRGSGADSWGDLKKKEKQDVINAFKAKFPSRYRQAVEEYYKRLQEGDD